MSRAIAVRLAFLLCLATLPWFVMGDEPESSSRPATKSGPSKDKPAASPVGRTVGTSEENILRALQSPTNVDWVELPLEECLHFLQTQKNIPIWINRTRIADEGVQLDTPVTLRLPDASLQSVLSLLLGPSQLATVIRDGVLVVTTGVSAEESLETRIHPVKRRLEGKDHQSLVDVVTATVDPDMWEDVGGPGTIRAIRGGLVIRQTERVHDEVAALLRDLESVVLSPKEAGVIEPRKRTMSAAETRIRRKLTEPVTVDWVDLPLEECILYLQNETKINVWIDRTTIQDEGIQMDTPITLRLVNHRLSHVLRLLLSPNELEWIIEDEVLKITSGVSAGEKLSTVVYDVRDLLALMPEPADRPIGRGFGGGIGGGGGGFFDLAPNGSAGRVLAQTSGGGGIGGIAGAHAGPQSFGGSFPPVDFNPVVDFEDVIMATVSPETWDAVGGPGVLREHLGALVALQTENVHAELQKLFDSMRKTAAASDVNTAEKKADPAAIILRVYQMPHHPSEELATSIPDLIASETWDRLGGKGTVRAVKGALLVRNTRAVHQQVIDLLNELPIWSYVPQPPATKPDPAGKTDPATEPKEPAKTPATGGVFDKN
jgi:hypothetical protein